MDLQALNLHGRALIRSFMSHDAELFPYSGKALSKNTKMFVMVNPTTDVMSPLSSLSALPIYQSDTVDMSEFSNSDINNPGWFSHFVAKPT